MNRNRELAKNTLIFSIGVFGSKMMQYILVPLYTVYMSTEEYGDADLIATTVTLIIPLFTLGIQDAVLRFLIDKVENRKNVLKISFGVCVSGTVLLCLLLPILNRISVFQRYIYWIPLLFFANSLQILLSMYCKGIEKNMVYSLNGIFAAFCLGILSVVFIGKLGMGTQGYLLAMFVSNVLSVGYLMIVCRKSVIVSGDNEGGVLLKEMLTYSMPLIPNMMSWWLIQMSDRYMVTYFCGSSLNGLYTMAYKIPGIFNMLFSMFKSAFTITAIKEIEKQVKPGKKVKSDYLEEVYREYSAVTFVVAIIVILCSRPFALLFLKEDFYQSWVYTPFLICAFAVGNLQAFYSCIHEGLKNTKIIFGSTMTGAIFNIILNMLWIPRMGAYGAALATFLSYVVVWFARLIATTYFVEMKHHIIRNLVSIGLIFGLSVLYVRYYYSVYFVGMVILVMICCIWKQEMLWISEMICKILSRKL